MKCFQIIQVGSGGATERMGHAQATVANAAEVIRASGKTLAEYLPVRLRAYDDDRNLVYEFRCSDEEAAEDAHDFARDDCGATYSTIRVPGSRRYDPFIG